MLKTNLTRLALLGAFALSTAGIHAQDSGPLIDALVRKGILNDQEAEEIRADLIKDNATTPAGKLNISTSVTELKLSGDTRLRYQYDNRDSQAVTTANDSQRSRYRFRLRLNADIKFAGPFFAGVGLETGQASDSGNQTFQDGFNDYDIFISRVFLGWEPTDWLTVIGGKQKNPFYTTNLVWDSDINPTGLVETVKVHKLFGWETNTSEGYAGKDGKGYVAPSSSRNWSDPGWELTVNAGQFIFDDNNEFNGPDNDAGDDSYLFVAQAVGAVKLGAAKLTVAPGWMYYNAADTAGLDNENAFTGVAGVSGETRHLNILLAPGDISFTAGGFPIIVYWDFAYNTEGNARGEEIYGIVTDTDNRDNFAWLVGAQIGKNKNAGDWSFFVNYRETGINAVDPNLNDSDFALGELNTRGFEVAVAYSLTDYLTFGVEYDYAWNLRDNLIMGQATNGAAIADTNAAQVLQVDLSWKF